MTENYDQQCVTDAVDQHSKTLKGAVTVNNQCRSGFTVGGTAVGLAIGLASPGGQIAAGLAGATVGTLVGSLVCDDLSGVNEAVKPPPLTHCETPDKSRRR